MNRLAPCKGCEQRNPSCHDSCGAYQDFQIIREQIRQDIARDVNANRTNPTDKHHALVFNQRARSVKA